MADGDDDRKTCAEIVEEHVPGKKDRTVLARKFLEEEKLRSWYTDKASKHKAWAHMIGLFVISAGAFITFLAAVKADNDPNFDYAIALIGFLVAIAQGLLRIWRFDETWIEYRKASEKIKRERRLFENAAGEYARMADDGVRYRYFVEAVEEIIAEEQQIFFKGAAKPQDDDDG